MSNLTIKEQLQALSVGGSKEASAHDKKKTSSSSSPSQSSKKPAKTKPAWLEQAQYGVELLKAYFPACFKDLKDIKPLKIGIKQDLVKSLSTKDDIVISDKACMVSSLAYYVGSIAYHKSVVEGAERLDLEGNQSGVVSAEEAKYSKDCRKSKQDKKVKQPQEKS